MKQPPGGKNYLLLCAKNVFYILEELENIPNILVFDTKYGSAYPCGKEGLGNERNNRNKKWNVCLHRWFKNGTGKGGKRCLRKYTL